MKQTSIKSVLVSVLWLLGLGSGLWAESAVFRDVKGKVEYLDAGGEWSPAKVGVEVYTGVTISTGFKSSAALEVMGSVIFVKPLTRVVLESLIKKGGASTTNMTLLAGKVKAEVKPSSETAQTHFEVKGPVATASVRGTGFEFDGVNLLVNHGEVAFSNQWNVSRSVQGGEFSSVGRGVSVTPPIPVKPAEKPQITAAGGASEVDAMFTSSSTPDLTPDGKPGTPSATDAGTLPVAPTPAVESYDLGAVIDTFGDDLLLDKGILSVIDKINDAKTTVLAETTTAATATVSVTVR